MVPRCVIVAGFPRSGTSWLARGLSFAPGFTYYREPDNHNRVAAAEERFAWLYLTADRHEPAYREPMTRACAGRIATAFTMRDDPGPLLGPFGAPGLWLGEADAGALPATTERAAQAGLRQPQSRLAHGELSSCPAAVHATPSLRPVRALAATRLGASSRPSLGN